MIHRPSKISSNKTLATTCLLLVGCILVFPGCQTFNSTFTSMPKLPKLSEMKLPGPPNLAFWKKETDAVPPPPPAHHLSPSSTQSLNQLADKAESTARNGIDIDEYRNKIDRMADGIAQNAKTEFANKKPLRAAYDSAENSFEKAASDFKSNMNTASKGFNQGMTKAKETFKTFESNTLSDAQNKFNAAIADVKKPSGNNDFKSPSEFLSTKPANDFKQAISKTNSQIQTGLKSGIDAAKKTVGGFDQSMAKVNKSLYDMNGNLTSGTSNAKKQIASSVDAARQRFSSALGTVSDKAMEAAKTSTEFGGGIKDKIVQTANEFKPQLRGGDNSFKPAFKAAVDPVATEAKNLLDKAKAKVAGLGTGFDFPSAQPKAPVQTPEFKPSNTGTFGGSFANKPEPPTKPESSFGGGTFDRTRVANVTRVEPKSTASSNTANGLSSKLTNAWNNGDRQSQLKPIGVGSSTSTPGNALRTASTQSGDFGSRATTIPSSFGNTARTATASHVMEIDIPSKVLSGSGSYAPGSVNKVR